MLRNFIRQTFDFHFARDELVQSALDLDAFGIAHRMHRHLDAKRAARSMRFKSTCSRFSLTGSFCQSTIITGTVSPPFTVMLKIVLCPVLLRRIWFTSLGLTATGNGFAPGAIQHRRRETADPQPPCFILAARGPRFRHNGNIFSHNSTLITRTTQIACLPSHLRG